MAILRLYPSLLYSRLIRNSQLRRERGVLAFPVIGIVFAPLVEQQPPGISFDVYGYRRLEEYFSKPHDKPLVDSTYKELTATIEGAKGIIRAKPRKVDDSVERLKGAIANKVESEIASFDERQKQGGITVLDGLQRIRGLAGSGKTIVLAMKAAQMHLRDPDANILYTFYTRSLYQHIQRLVTRFYRQYDDRDPDWTKLMIMHGWGGHDTEGVYSRACLEHGLSPLSFAQAKTMPGDDEFHSVCQYLLDNADIHRMYDYVFIDEGQDFPASFFRLCLKLAEKERMVYAYDDLQNIWRTITPAPAEIFGTDKAGKSIIGLSNDTILHKCYRNPREVLVCAHALGFGIYGSRIVQMLENREYWQDIGYRVISRKFEPGSEVVIERPAENSLKTISQHYQPNEIVKAEVYNSFDEEIAGVATQIEQDIKEGLRHDDILVVVVDDRYARRYLTSLTKTLAEKQIKANNIHADPYGIKDFYKEGQVTLSTVHKAKGNEAYSVYVVGIDALFASWAGPRERNMIFTAMTRAKGWVSVSGIGQAAETFKLEVEKALQEFPYLKFIYPSKQDLIIMKRDLEEKAVRKLEAERALEKAMSEMTTDEIMRFLEQRRFSKEITPSQTNKRKKKV